MLDIAELPDDSAALKAMLVGAEARNQRKDERIVSVFNKWLLTYISLAAAYNRPDQSSEATGMPLRIRELSPDMTVSIIEAGAALAHAFAAMVIPGLLRAGLAEC